MFSTSPVDTKAWKDLQAHYELIKGESIAERFNGNVNRFSEFSLTCEEILFDFSKNNIDTTTIKLLTQLAKECQLNEQMKAMFSGKELNNTENRAVLHTALRMPKDAILEVNGENIIPKIHQELSKIKSISDKLHSRELLGFTGKPIQHIVNIGVGGSDLGPLMVLEALKPFQKTDVCTFFISNVDGSNLAETLKQVDPETTLFLVASKTFTTQETMTNAFSARKWLIDSLGDEQAVNKHFVAMSTQIDKVLEFGILEENLFTFWDWVGGRFSLWSSIGLSISLSLGYDKFSELLKGAHEMDEHFRTTPLHKNIPVIMGLIGIWNVNFNAFGTEAILPYAHDMRHFPMYLQQLGMESNGKSLNRQGEPISYKTCPIIWGQSGTNAQHSFYQLIHQGTQKIPCDFIGFAKSQHPIGDHQEKLMANFYAQTEGLMNGKTEGLVRDHNPGIKESLIPFKIFKGGVPTNTMLIKELSPKNFGALIAMYEHKVFVQGVIWNINSFDQWGVELGKKLANTILPELKDQATVNTHDSSTNGLINAFKNFRS